MNAFWVLFDTFKKSALSSGFPFFGGTEDKATKNLLETLKNWEFCSPVLFIFKPIVERLFNIMVRAQLTSAFSMAAYTTPGGRRCYRSGRVDGAPWRCGADYAFGRESFANIYIIFCLL